MPTDLPERRTQFAPRHIMLVGHEGNWFTWLGFVVFRAAFGLFSLMGMWVECSREEADRGD